MKIKKFVVAATLAASGAGYMGYDQYGPRSYFGYDEKTLQVIEKVTQSKASFNANAFQKPGLKYEEDQVFHTMEYDPNAFEKLVSALFNWMASCVSKPSPTEPSPEPTPQPTPNPTPTPVPPQEIANWGTKRIHAPEANQIFKTVKKICIVDTGIDAGHPYLKSHVKYTKSWTGQNAAKENFGHGTHVAGIVLQTNNSADLYVEQALNDQNGSGNLTSLGQAMMDCGAQGATEINNSWGGGSDSPYLNQVIQSLAARGIRVVFAAGNESTQTSYPARLASQIPNVFSISATTPEDKIARFSNFGIISYAAPGENIVSTLPTYGCVLCNGNTSGFGSMSGTSMACPAAVGVISMVTTKPPGTDYIGAPSYFGQGLVNALKTVQ